MTNKSQKFSILEAQTKRINLLLDKVIKKLDKNTWRTIKSRIGKFEVDWGNSFGFKVNGSVTWINEEKTVCLVYFNLFSLRMLSKKAVTGVIAHELAHVFIEFKKTSKIRSWLNKKGIINIEKQADDLAKKWGFVKEIEQLYSEAKFYESIIPYKPEYLNIPVKDKFTRLSLLCPACKSKYVGDYVYCEIEYLGCSIGIYEQGYPKGIIKSRQPMSDLDMIKEGCSCPKCRMAQLIIRKRKITTPSWLTHSAPLE